MLAGHDKVDKIFLFVEIATYVLEEDVIKFSMRIYRLETFSLKL